MMKHIMSFIFWKWMKPLSQKYPEGKEDLKRVYQKYHSITTKENR